MPNSGFQPSPPPLPLGWTEHKAPTGHSYYFHAETKKSTYTRPVAPPAPPSFAFNDPGAAPLGGLPAPYISQHAASFPYVPGRGNFYGRGGRQHYNDRRREPEDRPKHKIKIPGAEPWFLVKTKLRRRFVYNPETEESLWKFPEDVLKAVVELDRMEREKKEKEEKREKGEEILDDLDEERAAAEELAALDAEMGESAGRIVPVKSVEEEEPEEELASDEEYEEVEVTDDEDEGQDGQGPNKRQRTEDPVEDKPHEFGEDDIAWQLEAMGEDYGLDPGEYGVDGEGDYEEGAEGLPLTDEDATALFMDLLDDFHISPFSTFDKIIEEGHIIHDDRYVALTTTKARREVWDEWARLRIQTLREQREKLEKKDPKIPYLAFLAKNASTKLYWPEFKRKYRKETEMKDTKLMDKDREKLYREHIARLKLPSSQLKSDLSTLLKSLSITTLNNSSQLAALPPQLLTDLRFYSLPEKTRNELVETYISTLPPPPEPAELSAEDEEKMAERKRDRERREQALREREKRVEEDKRRQDRELRIGKARLREGEREVEEALRVGNRGLKAQLAGSDDDKNPDESED